MSNKTNLYSNSLVWCLILINLIIISYAAVGDEFEQTKNRRGGTAGLFAFPRVGRSDPRLEQWEQYIPRTYKEYEDIVTKLDDMKPLSDNDLVSFPRTRRSQNWLRKWSTLVALQNVDKRTGSASANSGLWFGPRLGRVQK